MTWTPNFKKGTDLPEWDWLAQSPVSDPGCGNAYDGSRWLYWVIQSGSTSAASTTQLWRFDTWNEGWQFLVTLTSGFSAMDLEYDNTRGIVYVNSATTAWQIFNTTAASQTIANQAVGAMAVVTAAPVLPASAGVGTSFTMPDETQSAGDLTTINTAIALDTGICTSASTTTSLVDNSTVGSFGFGMVGLYARFTSGTLIGTRRVITAVPSPTILTTAAFGGTPGVGDAFVVELPEGTATSATVSTLTDTAASWTTNLYRDSDVVIVSGTGSGQRRRIGSHTGTVITLNAAVTGNARTGNWSVTPDATSVYRIVPSSDFLYYQPGGTTAIYRIDVVQTTGAAWSGILAAAPATTGGGANTMYAGAFDPFSILALRGAATATVYRYQLGLESWSTVTTFPGGETFTTGASAAMIHGFRRLFVAKESSQRTYMFDLTTGLLESGPFVPYAAPSAYDGHRSHFVKTADGVCWLYHLRPGGQEFFRVPLEWLV